MANAELDTKISTELSDDELLRYSRQILLDGWDMDAQLHLKNRRVLIIGAGGWAVAQTLARAGVECIHLLDHDTIDDSNLQRQTLFDKDDIGKHKAQVATARLRAQNHLIDITPHIIKLTADNALDVFGQVNAELVIDCTDNFAVRDVINRICMAMGISLLSNSAIAETGQIALFTADTGCYHCLFGAEQGDEQNCATSGVLASTVAIIGALTAQIALDYLGRTTNPIAGQLLLWQGRTMSLRKLNFQKNPNCPICTTRKS